MGNTSKFLVLLTATTATPSSPLLLHRCPSLFRLIRHHYHTLPRSLAFHRRYLPLSPSLSRLPLELKSSPHHRQLHCHSASSFALPPPYVSHPWPEWTHLLHNLSSSGYFNSHHFSPQDDDFIPPLSGFPEDFACAAAACLAFSRQRPGVLGMLSRRDVEVVVDNVTPSLFKNGNDSIGRMKAFLGGPDSNVLNAGESYMVDLMKFLLSYVSNIISSEKNNFQSGDLVESSVRNLLSELAACSLNVSDSNLSGSMQNQFPDRYVQTPRTLGQDRDMRRGDWICPRCSFMNFAKNSKCLECDEARPKRQLTGGEWDCPQCDFFNYGRNMVCLRCDCKRPGEVLPGTTNSRSDLRYGNGSYTYNSDVNSRLASNEEKAQRWFSKVSQLDGAFDKSSTVVDEDFPEILPLRKGVNRFVVSTRKSPLERRLHDARYQRSLDNDGALEDNSIQSNVTDQYQSTTKPSDESFGHQLPATEYNKIFGNKQNARTNTGVPASNTTSPQHDAPPGNSNYVPFVPLPADMFAKKTENEIGKAEMGKSVASTTGEEGSHVSEGDDGKTGDNWQASQRSADQTLSIGKEREQEEKSERWFKRVAELHNVPDLGSAISDEDFPEIMPMRKGENRFVVSKKKDRSLTSPMHKRQIAMEQANNTNFVPFVPFPPNYFSNKGNQQSAAADSPNKAVSGTSRSATPEKPREMSDDSGPKVTEAAQRQDVDNEEYTPRGWSTRPSCPNAGQNPNEIKADASYGNPTGGKSIPNEIDPQSSGRDSRTSGYTGKESISGTPNLWSNSPQGFSNPQMNGKESQRGGSSHNENSNGTSNLVGTSHRPSENQNFRSGWTGKSLEGSAVKESDPLDMSEEAKAERWFRRAAQIKDISELSQIPDEDFPEIMPMRKGVNRFVVSKRKTPLERRLTSTQYRKNLPIVSSDPVKENDSR
ncbi:hypothetical protein Tsubulata_022062 [Turnera subulata]|uniref:RanBP2-type domain-containing protein n=1 Tax=Turnera subulata TaxID=218843 RepID=A0A9Q0JEA3_9ROSI|nr:hypothetical protein Tsubulata_022062 [Turnera subulata]